MIHENIYPRIYSNGQFTVNSLSGISNKSESFSESHLINSDTYSFNFYNIGEQYLRIESEYDCWTWDEDGTLITLVSNTMNFIWVKVTSYNDYSDGASMIIIDTGHELLELESRYQLYSYEL